VPTLARPDLALYYELDGRGPPLLLIPGLASDSQSWAPGRTALARTFTLILPDPRGAGRSAPADAPVAIDLIAADCAALLTHLGIERAAVLGHSMGGLVAHRLAASAPGRVHALVLAASGLVDARAEGLLADLASAREAGVPAHLWFRLLFHWLFRPAFFSDPRRVADAAKLAAAYPYPQSTAAFRAQLAAAVAGAPRDGAAVTARTLVLSGRLDRLIDPAASRASFADIPGLTSLELEDAAHSLHWDQPEAFVAAVAAFLGQRAHIDR
jgi:pimeloyl-ACP methyl ester carboxylesterase